MLASFTAILTQDEQETATFTTLSGTPDRITTTGNLKWDSPPLPVDETALDSLWHSIGKRPCWLAASTHPGEEEQLLAVHRQLQQRWPDILLVLVPRHPHRGAAVQALAGSGAQCRTAQSDLLSGTSVYIADTMGEMGLWYRLCPLAFIGGSLVSHGGQNMLEAAQLGCIPLWGRHVHNFRPLAALLQEKGAGFQTDDHDALLQQLTVLLEDLSGCTSLQSHCREEAGKLGGASARTLAIINSFMHN
jgi:3-deoxy-D-manno-octulosonic-acid transferase